MTRPGRQCREHDHRTWQSTPWVRRTDAPRESQGRRAVAVRGYVSYRLPARGRECFATILSTGTRQERRADVPARRAADAGHVRPEARRARRRRRRVQADRLERAGHRRLRAAAADGPHGCTSRPSCAACITTAAVTRTCRCTPATTSTCPTKSSATATRPAWARCARTSSATAAASCRRTPICPARSAGARCARRPARTAASWAAATIRSAPNAPPSSIIRRTKSGGRRSCAASRSLTDIELPEGITLDRLHGRRASGGAVRRSSSAARTRGATRQLPAPAATGVRHAHVGQGPRGVRPRPRRRTAPASATAARCSARRRCWPAGWSSAACSSST